MERFIFEVIEPLITKQLEQQRHKERISKITQELKAFIKGQLIPINKELSKKTRELFVASSDIQKFKEHIQFLEREMNKLRQEVASRQNDIFKQKMMFEKDITAMKEEFEQKKKELNKNIKKLQLDIDALHEQYKDKIGQMKRQHKNELQSKLQTQKNHWEVQITTLKQTYAQEKSHLIQQTSKQKSKLIKKYQEKIYKLKEESDDLLDKTIKELTTKIEGLKKNKGDLENKLISEQQNGRRLALQLDRETSQHRAFRMQFESTFNELQANRKRNQQERQRLIDQYDNLKTKSKDIQRVLNQRIKNLQKTLQQTIEQKDKRYTDTVQMMNTQRRMQVESLQNNMMQEREIALTNIQVKSYEEMFQQLKKYQALQCSYRDLQDLYNNVKSSYQSRISKLQSQHQNELTTINERKEYEYHLSGQNSKREYNNLQTKYLLQIKSIKNQNAIQQQNIIKKAQEQKIALSNKLISQYEAMLSDLRSNTEIQIKQKLLQYQRKAKAFEKRIAQGQKRKSQLKVTIERMKLQSQMKIESMMQANEKLQEEIQSLHERILQLQKMKSTIINDYQFQLLLLKNEIDRIKDQYSQRQDQLRANLNDKIIVKNKEIARFAQQIKQQTEDLLKKHKERVVAIEKQYQQLKRVINQKTSLPEDIEALRVFHAAYIEKQNELISQRRRREQLQRELHSKDAIEKVFASKEAFKRLTVIDKFAATSGKLSFLKQV